MKLILAALLGLLLILAAYAVGAVGVWLLMGLAFPALPFDYWQALALTALIMLGNAHIVQTRR